METSPVRPPLRTWMPTTAGILSIVAGVLNLILGVVLAALGELIGSVIGQWSGWFWGGLGIIGAPLIVLGIASIIGGVFAIQRRLWGMALAGSICALFPPPLLVLGIPSTIFVSLAKHEFTDGGKG